MIPSAKSVSRSASVLLIAIVGGCGLTSSPWKDARARASSAPRSAVAPAPVRSDSLVLVERPIGSLQPIGSTTPLATGSGKVSTLLDVRDLLAPRTSFAGPRLLLQQGTALDESEGSEGEESVRTPDPADLLATIRAYTGPGPWEGADAGSLDITESGFLLVRTDPGTLAAISRFLGQ